MRGHNHGAILFLWKNSLHGTQISVRSADPCLAYAPDIEVNRCNINKDKIKKNLHRNL